MIEYIAIGKAKYIDNKNDVRVFKAENDFEARHYIINYFDSSLDWTYTINQNRSVKYENKY
tara:strand:- start:2 stop:184 length:183 start_codon:yes stop_codon:yes gene_type:complete